MTTGWLVGGWLSLAVPVFYLAGTSLRAGGLIGMKRFTKQENEQMEVAQAKVRADATLLASALAAVAKLSTANEPPLLTDQAITTADALLAVAVATAAEK